MQGLRPAGQGVLSPGHHRARLLRAEVPRRQQRDAVARPLQGNQKAVNRKR